MDPLLHQKTKTPHPAAALRCVDAGAELPGLPNPTLTGALLGCRATAVLGKLGALIARETSLRSLKKKDVGGNTCGWKSVFWCVVNEAVQRNSK